MNGPRLAALKLASLGAADRSWILQRLSSLEMQRLEPLMSSVMRLQAQDVQDVVHDNHALFQAAPPQNQDIQPPVVRPADIQVIRTASLNRLEKILDELDSASLALLLDSHDWPWLTTYLNRKGAATKDHLALVLKQVRGKVSAKLLELIVEKVALRLRPEPVLVDSKSRFETLLDSQTDMIHTGSGAIRRGRDGASA